MRISTMMIHEQGVLALERSQAAALKTQQELASGRRVLSPADDPVASAQALQVSQADAVNSQLEINRGHARARLTLTESSVAQAGDLLQNIRERAVQAGD